MTIRVRRTLVVMVSLMIFSLSFIIVVRTANYLRHEESRIWYFFGVEDPDTLLAGSAGTNANTNQTPAIRYYSFLALPVLLSLSFLFFLWDRRPAHWVKPAIYVLMLVVAFPIFAFNYYHKDQLISFKIQVLIDFLLVFLGSVNALLLLKVKPRSESGKVIQCMLLGFIFLFVIAVPASSGTLYLLYKLHVISATQANAPSSSAIAIIAGIPSTIVAVLNYKRTKIEEPKRLIILDGV